VPVSSSRPVGDGVCWSTVGGLGLIHVLGLADLVWLVIHPSAPTVVLAVVLSMASGVSVTAVYHRLLAQRTFRPRAAFRRLLQAFGEASFHSSALAWSAEFRSHDTAHP